MAVTLTTEGVLLLAAVLLVAMCVKAWVTMRIVRAGQDALDDIVTRMREVVLEREETLRRQTSDPWDGTSNVPDIQFGGDHAAS